MSPRMIEPAIRGNLRAPVATTLGVTGGTVRKVGGRSGTGAPMEVTPPLPDTGHSFLTELSPPAIAAIEAQSATAWFPMLAVAEILTADIVELTSRAESGAHPLTREDADQLLAALAAAGAVVETEPSGAPRAGHGGSTGQWYALDDNLLAACMADISSQVGGADAAAAALLSAGLDAVTEPLIGQLAVWARRLEAWDVLERLWREHWKILWDGGGRALASGAYRSFPVAVLRQHPTLSYISVAFQTTAQRGDETRWPGLIRDGLIAHGAWRSVKDTNTATLSATLSIGTAFWAGDYRAAIETVRAIDARILTGTRRGEILSPVTIANFNVYAATTLLLCGDIPGAISRADRALAFASGSGYAGPVAAGFRVLAYALLSDTRRYSSSKRTYERLRDDALPFAGLIGLPVHIADALTAIGTLDRVGAEAAIARAAPYAEHSEFWFAYELARIKVATLWKGPAEGLEILNLAEASHAVYLHQEGLPSWVMTRARAELLLAAGRVHHALSGLENHPSKEAKQKLLVPAVSAAIRAGDGRHAAALADSGIGSRTISLSDSLHLSVLKAAALVISGADSDELTDAIRTACSLLAQTQRVEPYANIPWDVREKLLHHHDVACNEPRCPVRNPLFRGRLATTRTVPGNIAIVTLTRREQVLLPLLTTNATAPEIAAELVVSVNTVRKQIAMLREKLGVRNRRELVDRCRELGFLPPTITDTPTRIP